MAKKSGNWQGVLGAGAILLFGVLMLFRLGIPDKLISGADKKTATVPVKTSTGEV
ncbi:MAG: hypothetical protein M0009_12925 [Deltaproteobacteria bacterium]|nr:hypothetical protein [Deltaproteobacteria bacterium]